MEGKVVFDFCRAESVTQEDRGEVTNVDTKSSGEIPDCFPKEWKEMVERVERRGISSSEKTSAGEHECSCGEHTLHWVVIASDVWAEDQEARMRVIERT